MEVDLNNKEFIEQLLKLKISDFTVKDGCAEGDNVAGSLRTIHAVTQTGEKVAFIFKSIPENGAEWISQFQIFRTEHAMYRTVVPLLRDFAASRGFTYEPPLPKYITGFNNDKSDYLVMEDLRHSGFIMPDKTRSLTEAEMTLILQELAKLHAVSYAMIKYEGDKVFEGGDDIMHLAKFPLEKDSPINGFDEMIQSYYEETTKLMKAQNPEVGRRMETLVPDAWKIRRSTAVNPKYFETIIHFDLWVNNLLIKYEEKSGQPLETKFIDFQFVQRGNIFLDLQYLIFTSTTVKFRKDHLISVLNVYYNTFTSTLDTLKCPLPLGFSRGFFIDEFYKCFIPGFIHMTFAIALQLGDISNFEGDAATGPTDRIQKYYLQSPVALERLESFANEVIQMKLI